MKKIFLILAWLPTALFAKPYYSEHQVESYIVIFYGNISEEDEPQVKILERKYMDENEPQNFYSNKFYQYKAELKKLGITIETIKNYDGLRSIPLESYPMSQTSNEAGIDQKNLGEQE